jgi:HAD superfamily hydrolase (TIGR01509 family)
LEEIGAEADFDALGQLTWDIHRAQLEAGAPVKRGARELLERLRLACVPMVLATSTPRGGAKYRLEKVGLWHYFCGAACGDEVAQGKPFPDIFQLAAQRCGLPAEQCIAVEDSPAGVRAAKRAGMAVALVPDMAAPDGVTRVLADVVAADLNEASDWIMEQLNATEEDVSCKG